MQHPIRSVRVSEAGRDQLIRLKRFTGVDQWNILCRWALLRSLAEPHPPSPAPLGDMSNIEMSWPVFAGTLSEALVLLMRQRLFEDGLGQDDETFAVQFRLHLHRGLAYLSREGVRHVEDLVTKAEAGLAPTSQLTLPP